MAWSRLGQDLTVGFNTAMAVLWLDSKLLEDGNKNERKKKKNYKNKEFLRSNNPLSISIIYIKGFVNKFIR